MMQQFGTFDDCRSPILGKINEPQYKSDSDSSVSPSSWTISSLVTFCKKKCKGRKKGKKKMRMASGRTDKKKRVKERNQTKKRKKITSKRTYQNDLVSIKAMS